MKHLVQQQARVTSNDVLESILGLLGATILFEKHHKEYLQEGTNLASQQHIGKYFFLDSS
jgi:hypothetical protein